MARFKRLEVVNGGLWWTRKWTFSFHKRWEILDLSVCNYQLPKKYSAVEVAGQLVDKSAF
jgi:hypothetical protein